MKEKTLNITMIDPSMDLLMQTLDEQLKTHDRVIFTSPVTLDRVVGFVTRKTVCVFINKITDIKPYEIMPVVMPESVAHLPRDFAVKHSDLVSKYHVVMLVPGKDPDSFIARCWMED